MKIKWVKPVGKKTKQSEASFNIYSQNKTDSTILFYLI